jgi:hypothetical protein
MALLIFPSFLVDAVCCVLSDATLFVAQSTTALCCVQQFTTAQCQELMQQKGFKLKQEVPECSAPAATGAASTLG